MPPPNRVRWTRDQLLIGLNLYHKLGKLGLREETIGYGPSKEKWEELNRERQEN